MTALTPEQMRALADELDVATRTHGTAFTDLRVVAEKAVLALRETAIRLEIDDAMVERAARSLFEEPSADGDWTWDDLLREDGPERAKLWRDHARAILKASQEDFDD